MMFQFVQEGIPGFAKLLGMGTGRAVSAQLARLPELIRTERRLEQKLRTIEHRLDE